MTRTRRGLLLLLVLAIAAVASGGCDSEAKQVRNPPAASVPASKPPSETLSPLLQQALPNVAGKTFTAAIVAFPPAARAAPHRHGKAFVYAYVLDGSVASRLRGHPRRTFHRGDDWVEQPGADHVLTENLSRTRPAKLLVVFVSDAGDPLKVDDPPRRTR